MSVGCHISLAYPDDFRVALNKGCGRHGGLIVSVLVSGSSGLGSNPGRGHLGQD